MDKEKIISMLEGVKDPEIPVLSIADLGILRDVDVSGEEVTVYITPTYSGCPAMETIRQDILKMLSENGIGRAEVRQVLSPAWTSDWISAAGKDKLESFGIAAPAVSAGCSLAETGTDAPDHCPLCHSRNLELISRFGSTACKALYRCVDCREAFDYFKCH